MSWAGRTLTLETGRLARQADGAVLVRYGDTVVLATAVASREPREGVDFFPLTVDYEERLYAVGRIPGGFPKREGKPSERSILAARLTDRPIRPLFPDGMRNDVQVIVTVLSVDYDCPFELCGLIGASAALHISDIPFLGPVGAAVVGLVDGKFVLNPTQEQQDRSRLHLTVAGTRDAVIMIEAGADQVPEDVLLQAIAFGQEHLQPVVDLQESLREQAGKPKREVPLRLPSPELDRSVRELVGASLRDALRDPDKLARERAVGQIEADVHAALAELQPELYVGHEDEVDRVLKDIQKEEMRRLILEEGVRADGRGLNEVRPISCEVGFLPRTHGSGLFTRGQTQVLSVCTLGAVSDVQVLDGLGSEEFKRYMHHYNFPPFSTGEARPLRAPSRRSIGHGALAERALLAVIPDEKQFPYTIRVVSEVLESNGSTSMASVCGSTLALMDAGVPIRAPVAGVAMGLVKEGERVAVLTDIQGMEDALGDMDFKVAGTKDGVTAIQMDIKTRGLSFEVLQAALAQAREARLYILDKMLAVIDRPRPELSPHAPRILVTRIDPDKIRDVIGPGGKTINRIIEETRVGNKKVTIDIDDDGTVHIAATNEEAGRRALARIQELVREIKPGQVYSGRVSRIASFGAFVEILPGKEGLVHISQLSHRRVGRVEDVVKVGDELLVKVTEIDPLGRINLSHREAVGDAHLSNAEALPSPSGRQGPAHRRTGPGGPPPKQRR